MHSQLLMVAVLSLGAACAAAPGSAHHSYPVSLCFVSGDELRQSAELTVYDALRSVRPTLLRRNLHEEPPIVVVDGVVTENGMAALQALRVEETLMIRRLSAADATQRYGLNQANAVIEVTTLRARPVALDPSAYHC